MSIEDEKNEYYVDLFCIKSQMKPILYVQIDGKNAKYVVSYGCR